MHKIPLMPLAYRHNVPQPNVTRWFQAGLLRLENRGSGPGRGYWVTREQAIEATAIFTLWRGGAPINRIKAVVAQLRAADKRGADFLALGTTASGKPRVLLDGDGDTVPLRDPDTGQMYLSLDLLDLRELRDEVETMLAEVAVETKTRKAAA